MKIAHVVACILSLAFSVAANATTYTASCNRFETGFSPEGGAEELVEKTIDSAMSEIRVMSYSLSSRDVEQHLIKAIHRRVTVFVIADESNLHEKGGIKTLSNLAAAGAGVRTIDAYKIHHDKVIIVDGRTVEFGSFNYSHAAEVSNSENANTCWDSPAIAQTYSAHWQSRWDQGVTFQPRY